MEYLVPLLIVLVIVVLVLVAAKLMGRKGRAVQDAAPLRAKTASPEQRPARRGREVTREMAEAANARLNAASHRVVYSLIARQQVLNAVKEYRKATGSSLGQAAAAVAALAQFPQTAPGEAAKAPQKAPDSAQAPAPVSGYRYRAIVSRGDQIREVASTRLNEEIFTRVQSMARKGNYDGAARLLREHADIDEAAADEFVSMIERESPQSS
ncbi:hypothetical protein [Arthrobacter cryoconiti]|uniref:50S ribosomal protein L7/L12 n=1 Tax=Arthrobacter cryoconiti TaxID=748907 RepID=A0ABV8R2D4_9MICC|nr:hypothetical protein [Arthrobacter cryoconiti]MCC9069788.1 hypothetical protein [Arthrobacter cryoconiti]